MASIRARAFNGVRRVTSRLLFSRTRPLNEYSRLFVRADRRAARPLPSGYCRKEVIEPLGGLWIRRNLDDPRLTILHLHGGAFIMRMPNTHTGFVATLCVPLQAQAFLPWYRLAPQHPIPAAAEDALSAYRYLLGQGCSPDRIVISGDSVGGNLALSLLHQAKIHQLPMPAGAVLLSPITEFAQISGASKAGVWNLTKTVALHCARSGYNIRCNSLHPGLTRTPMMDRVPKETIERLESGIPMSELGQPVDIANAALYLASDESRYTTCTALVVDGGYTI